MMANDLKPSFQNALMHYNSQVPDDEVDECGIPIQDVFVNRRFLVYKILK